MARYALVLRDAARRRVLEVDHFARFEATLRFNDVGGWLLDLPAGSVAARAATTAMGLIVERDGATLLSGPIIGQRRRWAERESVLTLTGADDMVHLRDAVARPVPDGPPYDAADHDVRSGVASTVLGAYVAANVGPGARWSVPGLVVGADPVVGTPVTGRARFVNLLELLRELALAGGDLGFRVVQAGTALAFGVSAPRDRTATAVLSPLLGTLAGFEYAVDPPEANHLIVAGGGEGVLRVFVEQDDPDSIAAVARRIVRFRDRRDTSDPVEMAQTAAEELATGAARTSLSVTPLDTAGLAFGRDYGLGDRVTVVVTEEDGVTDPRPTALATIQDVVREVRLSLTPERGEEVAPLIGTPQSQAAGAWRVLAARRELGERLSALERR